MLRLFSEPTYSIDDTSMLVTGGTGSFGSAFIEHVLKNGRPRRIIVFSRDELKQYEMQQRFKAEDYPFLRYFIGDVRDRDRLAMAMRDVDVVVHAAALKHVAAAEYNPFECIRTNVIGAENIVQAAIASGVSRVVALSTDKAANPANLYGASKLAADKIFVAGNNLAGKSATRFSVVRYGNVIGSRGSVVPLFRRLVDEKADFLPITDARMTRFWISLEQGVRFVLSSMALMRGGEIFIPKIPSSTVADLAAIIAPGLKQRVIGIRPGEKLHETLITADDARHTVELDDRYIILPEFPFWTKAASDYDGAPAVDDGFVYASNQNPEAIATTVLEDLLQRS